MKTFTLMIGVCFAGLFAYGQFDTTRIAVIPLDTNQHWSWFLKGNMPYRLKQTQIPEVDSILQVAIHNNHVESNRGWFGGRRIGEHIFYQQWVPSINNNQEIIVWVNCFCESFLTGDQTHPPSFTNGTDNWKKEIVIINDGGGNGCFFNVKINLTTKKYSELYVNGM